MKKLIAEFLIKLPGFVLLSDSQYKAYSCNVEIDGFNVKVELVPFEEGARLWTSIERRTITSSIDVKIIVSENKSMSPAKFNSLGEQNDSSPKIEKVLNRTSEYQAVALKAVNRAIVFFRYKLHTPLLSNIEHFNQDLHNPKWTDEDGTVVENPFPATGFPLPIPGISDYPGLGIKFLTQGNLPELEAILQNSYIPELHEEILADAQDAIYQRNFRRAVLEMAIAVEVVVKSIYFGADTSSSVAIDYLEDKGRVNLKIIELIDAVAKQVFGGSFKEVDREAFSNIDFLFRCRNKAAHKGKLFYRDDQGKVHEVDEIVLTTWWKSVFKLFEWLKSVQVK